MNKALSFASGLLIGALVVGVGGAWLRHASHPAPAGAEMTSPKGAGNTHTLPAIWRPEPGMPADEVAARIASWLALDPATSSYAERGIGLRALLVVADDKQLADLVDRLARRGARDDAHWFEVAFAQWVERDPEAATRWTATLGSGNRLPADIFAKAREKAALAWAAKSFDPAYAWALAQPDAGKPEGVAARLLGWLAESDPEKAVALADARGKDVASALLKPIFDTWGKRDPEAALRSLGPRLLAAGVNFRDLTEILRDWTKKSPDAAVGWIVSQHSLSEQGLDTFADMLGCYNDRLESAAALARLSDPELKFRLLSHLLVNSWPVKQEQAAAFVDKLDDPDLRARIIESATKVTFGDTEANLPLALLLPPGSARDHRLAELTSAWAGKDPVAALAWLREHDEPAVAAAVEASALGAIARDEPQTALDTWATLPDGPIRDGAAYEIAKGWAHQNPAEAAVWLATQSDSRGAPRDTNWDAMRTIMEGWVAQDADTAFDWAQTRLDTAHDDAPLYNWAAQIITHMPPPQAAEQIGRIGNTIVRNQALYNLISPWLRRDLTGAKAWLQQQTIVPPDQANAMIAEAEAQATR